jgi:hypothetical protein
MGVARGLRPLDIDKFRSTLERSRSSSMLRCIVPIVDRNIWWESCRVEVPVDQAAYLRALDAYNDPNTFHSSFKRYFSMHVTINRSMDEVRKRPFRVT